MFRLTCAALVAAVALSVAAEPAALPPAAPKDKAKKEGETEAKRAVKELLDEFVAALNKKAPEEAATRLSDNFTWVTADGTIVDRKEWITCAKELKLSFTDSSTDKIKEVGVVQCVGGKVQVVEGTAVVVANWVVVRDRNPTAVLVRFTLTAAKMEKEWKILAVQLAAPRG